MVELGLHKKYFAEKFEELVSVFDDLVHLSFLLKQDSVQSYIKTGVSDYSKLQNNYTGLQVATESKADGVMHHLAKLTEDAKTAKNLQKVFLDFIKCLLEYADSLLIDMAESDFYGKAEADRTLISSIQRQLIIFFKQIKPQTVVVQNNIIQINYNNKTA